MPHHRICTQTNPATKRLFTQPSKTTTFIYRKGKNMAKAKKKAEKTTVSSDASTDAKRQALETAILQIEKEYGKGSIMKLGSNPTMEVSAISTGSLTLDVALGIGGLPRGRIVEIYGPESSGKTTLALHCVAETQKIGGIAAYIDVENALDPPNARKVFP